MNAITEINADRPARDIIYIGTPRQMYKKAIREMARSCGITEKRLMSNLRDPYTSYVRFLCYAKLRSDFRFSYPRIAQIMGKGDHTTIIHGIRRLEEIKASGKIPVDKESLEPSGKFEIWSDEDNDYLREFYFTAPISVMQIHLRRTQSAICQQARKIGLIPGAKS